MQSIKEIVETYKTNSQIIKKIRYKNAFTKKNFLWVALYLLNILVMVYMSETLAQTKTLQRIFLLGS